MRPSGITGLENVDSAIRALEEQATQFDIVEPKPHVTMRNRKSSNKAESGHDTETWREKIKEEKEEDD